MFWLLLILFLQAPLFSEVFFHGSPHSFDVVEPQPSTRFKEERIIWNGTAIFATQDIRIALLYTHDHNKTGYVAGVDLYEDLSAGTPVIFFLYGGSCLEEALDALFGKQDDLSSTGYIYLLDSSFFGWEEGLANNERVSRQLEANLGKMRIDRRALINHYLETGQIALQWKSNL